MKIWLLIVSLTAWSFSVFGQTMIQGKVSDGKQDLPSAAVMLFSLDTMLVKGMVTDSAGNFAVASVVPGKYFIEASMMGYAKYFSKQITVESEPVIIPVIILEEAVTELGELVVKSEKLLLDQKIDRLVVQVADNVTSSGNSVLEILQKCPGVVVNKQNNTISMNSKSGVRLMINGKVIQVSIDVAIQMLDGMSASNVENIELITTPPASLDAEGSAGIIHIVTRQNIEHGTLGSIGITLGYRWAETLGGSFNLHHRTKNFACFVDYSMARNHNLHILKMKKQLVAKQGIQEVDDYSHRENITNQQNLSGGLEWKLGDRTTFNALFTAYRRAWRLDATAIDVMQVTNDSSHTTTMDVEELNLWQSVTGSIGLMVSLNSKSKIRFATDFLFYHNDNPSNYDVNDNINKPSKIDLTKTTPIETYVATADYEYDVSPSLSIEAGIKTVASALDNNVLVQRGVNGEWNVDPAFTSYSQLQETVAAGYVLAKLKTAQDWQINTGLRYEYTRTSISTPTEKDVVNRKYGYFFPSLSAKKILDTEKDIQFSYARRITRPTYNDIAPYVFLWSTNSFSAGNTSLYPSLADAITAGFHVKEWLISVHYTHSRKEIAMMQPQLDSQSESLFFISQNLKYLNTVGFTNSYSHSISRLWELQGTITAQYQKMRTAHLEKNFTLDQIAFNSTILTTVKLPKDFTIEISGMYQSTSLSGVSRFLAFGSLNAGLQKKMGEKGILRISVDDILGTNNWRIKTLSLENNLNTFFDYDWNNRFVRLSYTLSFGNTKVTSVKVKSATEEERNRVNN